MARVESYNRYLENPLLEGAKGGDSVCDIYSVTHNLRANQLFPFGSMVVWNATTNKFQLPSATGQKPKGIVVLSDLFESVYDSDDRKSYPLDQPINLMEQGLIRVWCENAWDEGDPVYFRHTANGAGKDILGRFRSNNDSASNTLDLLANASFRDSGAVAGIALLKINLP